MTWLLLVVVAIASFLAGIVSVFWWLVPKIENRFIFRPDKRIFRTPADQGIPFEKFSFNAADGVLLQAWHLCPPDAEAGIVYFHGNSGNLGLFSEIFQLLYEHGLQVFAVDYRGYGDSQGTPSEEGIHLDALATVDYFESNLRIPGLPTVFWGRSLGGCIASYAASHRPPDGLILESTFPSKKDLMPYFPQFRLFYLFSKCRLESVRYLAHHSFPILVMHGDRDRTIPFEQGRLLYERLTEPKEFYHVEGADHVNIHKLASGAYMDRVKAFLQTTRPQRVH